MIKMTSFSQEEREFLCIIVQNYAIYDKSHKDYKNQNAKLNVWNALSEEFKEKFDKEYGKKSVGFIISIHFIFTMTGNIL